MREPALVADSVAAMIAAVADLPGPVPVTVKCRLGVDDDHDFDRFLAFVDTVADAGCRSFVVHARNAWLQGLSPKENRTVPPLRYDWAYRLKALRPSLQVVVNGGGSGLNGANSGRIGGLRGGPGVAERHHREVPQGAVVAGARPLVDVVGGVDRRHQRGVELLDDHRADEPDSERGRIAPHLPGHRVGAEEPVILRGLDVVSGGGHLIPLPGLSLPIPTVM